MEKELLQRRSFIVRRVRRSDEGTQSAVRKELDSCGMSQKREGKEEFSFSRR